MKLPQINSMDSQSSITSILNQNSSDNLGPVRYTKQGSRGSVNGTRRPRDTLANTIALIGQDDESNHSTRPQQNRYTTMKRVAEEQRKKVREIREKQQEEERIAIANRKQEELCIQIRTVLDNILVDVRKDILVALQERINAERGNIKDELKSDLKRAEESLTSELERRLMNGEPFDKRVARVQKEFEDSFNKILKTELGRVQREVLQDVEQRIEKEKTQWEETFRREADNKVRTAETTIRTEFQTGLEDSQKHCKNILKTTSDRIQSMEHKLTERIEAGNTANAHKADGLEKDLRRMIENSLDERDKTITYAFTQETDRIKKDITEIRGQVSQIQSKCCTIL